MEERFIVSVVVFAPVEFVVCRYTAVEREKVIGALHTSRQGETLRSRMIPREGSRVPSILMSLYDVL